MRIWKIMVSSIRTMSLKSRTLILKINTTTLKVPGVLPPSLAITFFVVVFCFPVFNSIIWSNLFINRVGGNGPRRSSCRVCWGGTHGTREGRVVSVVVNSLFLLARYLDTKSMQAHYPIYFLFTHSFWIFWW